MGIYKVAEMQDQIQVKQKQYLKGLARAFGGAIIFTLPILMTMEMWYLGFYMERIRLALFLLVLIPLLTGLSYKIGFRADSRLIDNIADAFAAFMAGTLASIIILFSFNVISLSMPAGEVIGKVSLQVFPASIGAVISRGLLGGKRPEERSRNREKRYFGEIFIMAAGALFLTLNLAPTEEIILISFRTTEWHILGIMILSLIIMHIFVYSVEFHGTEQPPEKITFRSIFFRYTIAGYSVVLLMSLYILWTFGRVDDMSLKNIIMSCTVLGFPGSIGAAAARLIL